MHLFFGPWLPPFPLIGVHEDSKLKPLSLQRVMKLQTMPQGCANVSCCDAPPLNHCTQQCSFASLPGLIHSVHCKRVRTMHWTSWAHRFLAAMIAIPMVSDDALLSIMEGLLGFLLVYCSSSSGIGGNNGSLVGGQMWPVTNQGPSHTSWASLANKDFVEGSPQGHIY